MSSNFIHVVARDRTSLSSAAAKSRQSCPTMCDPIDGTPLGSPVPGILQARTLEWVAISFSNAWKWKVKVKLLSHVWLLVTPWTAAYQAPPSMGFFQARVLEWGAIAFSALSSKCFEIWFRKFPQLASQLNVWRCLQVVIPETEVCVCATGTSWAEASDSGKYPTCTGQPLYPPTKNYLASNGQWSRLNLKAGHMTAKIKLGRTFPE